MKIIGMYNNGNYRVVMLEDGTKIRYNDEDTMIPSTVESIDIKITNCCDMGCSMCHEDSKPDGKHADIMNVEFLKNLHPYTELAIGGGNPLEHPDLVKFLEFCKEKKFIPNITINQYHFMQRYDFVKELVDKGLVYGVGISLTNPLENGFISKVKTIDNAVIHVIAGLHNVKCLEVLADEGIKILILGYKVFRRGASLYETEGDTIKHKIDELSKCLKNIIDDKWFKVISFDNLAIKQLNVKSTMDDKKWEEFYMGDDGIDGEMTSASMYVDLVKGEFAKNSCSTERYPIMNTVEEMYDFLKSVEVNKNE